MVKETASSKREIVRDELLRESAPWFWLMMYGRNILKKIVSVYKETEE